MKNRQKISPKPSTRAFYKFGKRISDYSIFDFIHGYVYMRWPYFYIGIGTNEHPLTRFIKPLTGLIMRLLTFMGNVKGNEEAITFEDTYHGKVVLTDSAVGLVTIEEDITLENLEPIIPYALARDIVIKHPDHIVVLDCPCRSARPNPCLPLDVCLVIGEPFASFVHDHHPGRSRRISQGEAVEILHAEHERGHVHHAFFKDAMLGRFYAICNCCSCCCGAMQQQRNGVLMLTSSGYLCHVDQSLCVGCGICEEVCPFDAIEVRGMTLVVDEEACMGCGVCVDKCEMGALRLELDPQKGEPLEIQKLMEGIYCSV